MVRAFDVQRRVVTESLFGAYRCYFFELNEAPECLRDFNVDQVRSMQAFLRHQRPRFDFLAFFSSKHELQNGRCVDDDQRLSRSARTSSVGEVFPR